MVGRTALFVSDLVGNPEDRFSHNEAQLITDRSKAVLLFWISVFLVTDASFGDVIVCVCADNVKLG